MTDEKRLADEAAVRAGCPIGPVRCKYPNCNCDKNPRMMLAALESLRASQQGGMVDALAALKVARPHVAATNDSEHMLDGFKGWQERASDLDLSQIDDAIASLESPPLPLSDRRNAIIEECAKIAVAAADCVRIGDGEYGGGKLNAARNIANAIRDLKSTKPGDGT